MRQKKQRMQRSKIRRIARVATAKGRVARAKNTETQLKDVWSNSKAGNVGFMAGQGFTSKSTASVLADGTSPDTVRRMWRSWGLEFEEQEDRYTSPVPILLNSSQRQRLFEMAKAEGMKPVEFLRKIAVVIIDDKHNIYKAILDED